MKVMKLALLGTAALVVASMGARAENLDTLKAQMDSLTLNAVADAPAAATTSVTWTGWVRGGIATEYSGATLNRYTTDIIARGEIVVVGKTDTAVGEVGAKVALETSGQTDTPGIYNGGNGAVTTDGFSGWWKLTPNVTMSVGILGNLSKSGYSYDAICTCWYNGSGGGINASGYSGDPAAVQLAYADGPLSFAVQVEDANNSGNNSAFGASAKIGYKADMFGIDLNGGYWGNTLGDAAWSASVGLGATFNPVSLGVVVGTGHTLGFATGFDYTKAGGFAKLALGDTSRLELGIEHDFGSAAADTAAGQTFFGGGVYYSPVKQITIGAEAGYTGGGTSVGNNNGAYAADLVTVFSF